MISFRQEITLLMKGVERFEYEARLAQEQAAAHSESVNALRRAAKGQQKTKKEILEEMRSRIVDLLRCSGPMGPTEAARAIGKDRGTVHKHLTALAAQGRVVRKSATRYEASE